MPTQEYLDFIHTRPFSWWRGYMHRAYSVYEDIQKRSITKEEKRRLWARLKEFHNGVGISSSGTLAIMESVMQQHE